MPINIFLKLAYDGTRYFGWQKTAMGPSVEAELEKVLEKILQSPVKMNAAGRTDRGVHALGQVVNFYAERCPPLISLNRLLPDDIAPLEIKEVPLSFHATLDALSKHYRYEMTTGAVQLPQRRLYEWHYPSRLSLKRMREAASYLVGLKDFKSLTNKKINEVYADTVREVTSIEILETSPTDLRFEIHGKNFLYKMVRNIVGLLVRVGEGKIESEELPALLSAKDRRHRGLSAPALGLTLISLTFQE